MSLSSHSCLPQVVRCGQEEMTSPQREPGSGRTERSGAGLRSGMMVNLMGGIRAVHSIVI